MVSVGIITGILLGGLIGFYGTLFATVGGDILLGWAGVRSDLGGRVILLMVCTVPAGATLGGFSGYGAAKAIFHP